MLLFCLCRFEYLLSLVGPLLKKRDMCTALSPAQRLAMTLRYAHFIIFLK